MRKHGYRGIVISDWDRINIDSPTCRRQIQGALNNFVNVPLREPYGSALRRHAQAFHQTGNPRPIQAFATGDDFPTSVTEVLEKFHQTTDFDLGYEAIFNIKDMTGMRRASFDITDVTSGLTFSKTEIGERAKLYKMSGEKTNVPVDMYSGGLHWHRTLFDDEEYWTLEDNAIQFRNKFWSGKAQDHYDLIDAVSSAQNLNWQAGIDGIATGTADYAVQRDVKTINTACVNILDDLKDKGYGIGPQSSFILLAPIQLKDRITNALNHTFQAYASSPARLQYNVSPIFTLMLAATDVYYVIFPKNKIIGANRMNLKVLTDMNITTYSELAVGWARYGGVIADEEQFQRCSTS